MTEDEENFPYASIMAAIVILKDEQPLERISTLTGCLPEFIEPVYNRICKAWPDRASVFRDESSLGWVDQDADNASIKISFNLHLLVAMGTIIRDPVSTLYSLSKN